MFGYGSLVSPASFAVTLGRPLRPGVDFFEAEIAGFGRRWNYGVMHARGETYDAAGRPREWTIVALGLAEAPGESANGVVAWVADTELAELDRRERYYDRVEVAHLATVHGEGDIGGSIVTYVPRAEPKRWYESARERGAAAIEQRYWDLVDGAFADLGPGQHARYHATTPPPDVPVLAMRRESVPARHLVREPDRGGTNIRSEVD